MRTKTDLYSKLTNKIVYDGIVYDPYGNKQFRYILWIGNGKGIRIALNENEEYLFMDRFGENSFDMFGQRLSSYNKYNNFLRGKLQLSGCDDNFFYVEEAIYPITFDYHNVTKLSSIKLPFDVKDDESLFYHFCGNNKRIPIPHFNLFVLTENSD